MKEPTVRGLVTEVLPNQLFRVKLDDGKLIIAHLAGKLRLNHIRCMAGDAVSLVLSPDGDKGRIVYRG
ncbi:translation initiation factor IF-1 [Candidatus Shapirobacteria bacterium RBG_13_44_7]|uniref:Translation initiation factor IF-1 n=1 Tax=Candidatus Shapirobacteria bacterium RBG_13_44_7 TaxID=1802149 RepID=A0A1F7SIF8_9BACT|nr:MAG: translation initiation factor IF-1 [Candidatus Shapirobacteria bacterium RBG_13_44_7]